MAHMRIRRGSTKGGFHSPDLDFGVSKAVRAGNLVFLQGQTGITLDGKTFIGKGDPAGQAENAMQCVKVLLEEAGAKVSDICKVTIYVSDHASRKMVYPVVARHLEGVYPVSTGLVVRGFAHPDVDFEIDVFAVVS